MTTAERHLSADSFARYLHAAVPIEHPIPGDPRLLLFIDPEHHRIGLRGPAGRTPPPTGLEHLTTRTIHDGHGRMTEIAVTDPRLFTDAYPLLCAVADRIQISGQTLPTALAETLRHLGHLLRPQDTLAREVEIGLLGELCVVGGLLPMLTASGVLAAWRGGQAEEHDFGLPDHDVEVKTTTAERREHWISSLTQLVPTGRRPLWLVSAQVTRAGTDGRNLPELIGRIRDRIPAAADRDVFDARMRAAGWRDRFTDTCTQRWRLRTRPAAYAVTDDFPRLTPALLAGAGVDNARVTDVRYRIDLSGRPADAVPADLETAFAAAEQELP